MADVRSLLRSEQASRRISHPHLTYTRSGQLLCTVCGDLAIKSASLWEGHLRSPNHRKNAQKAAESLSTVNQARKRKNDGGEEEESRKRRAMSEDVDEPVKEVDTTTTTDRPKKKAKSVTFAEDTIVRPASPRQEVTNSITVTQEEPKDVVASPLSAAAAAVDEDEWAAFERELAPLAKDAPTEAQYSATIVAAPVLATQPSESEPENRKPNKELEAEEEKEDDERRLEEELDVMEEMEERVRRLKQKRESLRKSPIDLGSADLQGEDARAAAAVATANTTTTVAAIAASQPTTNGDTVAVDREGESEDDDDDYDDYDDWGFR